MGVNGENLALEPRRQQEQCLPSSGHPTSHVTSRGRAGSLRVIEGEAGKWRGSKNSLHQPRCGIWGGRSANEARNTPRIPDHLGGKGRQAQHSVGNFTPLEIPAAFQQGQGLCIRAWQTGTVEQTGLENRGLILGMQFQNSPVPPIQRISVLESPPAEQECPSLLMPKARGFAENRLPAPDPQIPWPESPLQPTGGCSAPEPDRRPWDGPRRL